MLMDGLITIANFDVLAKIFFFFSFSEQCKTLFCYRFAVETWENMI